MFRFLLTRRWVLFGLFVVALGATCWRLGVWQFHRLDERRTDNAIIEHNLRAPAVPASTLMRTRQPLPEQRKWRKVNVTGTYDLADQAVVRYHTRNGQPGASVVTPLLAQSGRAVLVERGWMAVSNNPTAPVHPPPPASGTVTVTGWALPDRSDDLDEVKPIQGGVRLISSRGFTGLVQEPLMQGYVTALNEKPAPAGSLVRAAPPELSDGPHFFYGLQWWFFAALAVGGFVYFAYAEARDRRQAV